MKGSSLSIEINNGFFDSDYFNPESFEPSVEIYINEKQPMNQQSKVCNSANTEEGVLKPEWNQQFVFNVAKPTDEITFRVMNGKTVLGEKTYAVGNKRFFKKDPLSRLRTQSRVEDIIFVNNDAGQPIGSISYYAIWIYNVTKPLRDHLGSLKREKAEAVFKSLNYNM